MRPRRGRAADGDTDFAIITHISLGLEGLSTVEGDDIGVDFEGDDGGSVVGELLHDKESGSSVFKEEEHEGIPYDALEDH